MLEIRKIDKQMQDAVCQLITNNWGSPIMVAKGRVHSIDKLPGYVAFADGNIAGLITYYMDNGECEIVSLDSLIENQGIGSRLLEEVIKEAKTQMCKRIWLITTNDNTRAIRFYQKRGFNMAAIHINAVNKAREIKPAIPLYGYDNIPIMHEIEFEMLL